MPLTATRGNKKAFTVEPLVAAAPKRTLGIYLAEKLAECNSEAEVDELINGDPVISPHLQRAAVQEAIAKARAGFAINEDPAPSDGAGPLGKQIAHEQPESVIQEQAA